MILTYVIRRYIDDPLITADSDSAVSSESRAADPGAKQIKNSPRLMVRRACTVEQDEHQYRPTIP